jgi:hypothetical protein
MIDKILDKIVNYVFELPKYPLRFRELMEANRVYIDNLDINQIPGIKFCKIKLYIVYFIIWNLILIPLSLIFHSLLAKLDCHIAIVLAIIFTLLFFGTYKIFEEKLKRLVALKIIKNSWQNYLPHFNYEKYKEKVAHIYKEAIDRELPKSKIEQFVIDKIIESK